jgi:hypothetical protein
MKAENTCPASVLFKHRSVMCYVFAPTHDVNSISRKYQREIRDKREALFVMHGDILGALSKAFIVVSKLHHLVLMSYSPNFCSLPTP